MPCLPHYMDAPTCVQFYPTNAYCTILASSTGRQIRLIIYSQGLNTLSTLESEPSQKANHVVQGASRRLHSTAAAVSRALADAAGGRVHLFVALPLELVVQNTGCKRLASYQENENENENGGKNILRISKPNWGNSRHRALNSSSASDRNVCDLAAQKLATGARMVVSSREVLA